jgi:uncharacterized protein YkwD
MLGVFTLLAMVGFGAPFLLHWGHGATPRAAAAFAIEDYRVLVTCPGELGSAVSYLAQEVTTHERRAGRPLERTAAAACQTDPPELIAVPSATPTERPYRTATPVPDQDLNAAELDRLRQVVLVLVNEDRADHGLPPVELGMNAAAQLHAEDMLTHEYLGHWWTDGRKPYMVYSQTGGTSYASENAAFNGWTAGRWEEANCGSFLVECQTPEPEEALRDAEWGMMYDDAHANWGHRDNILGGSHRKVNIGIAWNGRLTTFVQHFEGGDVAASSPPSLSPDGQIALTLDKVTDGVEIADLVTVYHDPLPSPKTTEAIEQLDSYCVGGGFTTECGEPVARILSPPGLGYFYPQLEGDAVVANAWEETSTGFSFSADLGPLAQAPGVYTIHLWQDDGSEQFSTVLLELSAFQDGQ